MNRGLHVSRQGIQGDRPSSPCYAYDCSAGGGANDDDNKKGQQSYGGSPVARVG